MFSHAFEIYKRIIVAALIFMMSGVIFLATLELGRKIFNYIFSSPIYLLDINQLLEVFSFVLIILIGVELVETIRTYFVEHQVHVEVVLEIALIAIARKILIVDVKEFAPLTMLGIAALVLALAAGFYLKRKCRFDRSMAAQDEHHPPGNSSREHPHAAFHPINERHAQGYWVDTK
jgi:uncharacterized membrane protein (DUF373 family)